jgi:hypothetical protein
MTTSIIRTFLLAAALATAPAACTAGGVPPGDDGDDDGPDAAPIDCTFTTEASVIAGGGTLQTGFLALADGADMDVTLGPQGLYMVTPAIRASGIYPGRSGSVGADSDPLVVIALYKDGVQIGGSAAARIGLTPGPSGAELLQIFSPFTAELATYDGQLVTIQARVDDACGRSATDTLEVRARSL